MTTLYRGTYRELQISASNTSELGKKYSEGIKAKEPVKESEKVEQFSVDSQVDASGSIGKLDEAQTVEKSAEVQVVEKPAEVQVVEKPAEVQVVEKPAEVQVVEKPAEVQVVEKPAEVQVVEKPADSKVEDQKNSPSSQGNIFDVPEKQPAATPLEVHQSVPKENIFDTEPAPVEAEKKPEEPQVEQKKDDQLLNKEEIIVEEPAVNSAEEIGVMPDQPNKPKMEYSSEIEVILSYMIKSNESVYSISSKFGIPADKLCEINGIDPSKELTPGRLIAIPNLPELISEPEKQLYRIVSDKMLNLSIKKEPIKSYDDFNGIGIGL